MGIAKLAAGHNLSCLMRRSRQSIAKGPLGLLGMTP
jgi:hypothetical protein